MAEQIHSLLQPRTQFKPFEYPWAFDLYQRQQQSHWLPEEVPLHDDVRDWHSKLTEPERNLLTQIFRFFTQADIDVAGGYINKYLPIFQKPEIRMMLLSFGSMEAIHIHAYSLLIETVGMRDEEYLAFQRIPAMADKHAYLDSDAVASKLSEEEALLYDIAKFSAFTEGLHLFSTFAILLSFPLRGLMKGMGQIVTWSVRDESLHVEGMTKLFRELVKERGGISDDLDLAIRGTGLYMVRLEEAFLDTAFALGHVEGITKEQVMGYVCATANARLQQLGLSGTLFDNAETHELGWLDWTLSGVEHANFFETRATEYSTGALTGCWSDVWNRTVE